MKIIRNKNPAGKPSNAVFGLAEIVDGIVRIVTLGFYSTTLPLDVSRWQAQKTFANVKKARLKAQAQVD